MQGIYTLPHIIVIEINWQLLENSVLEGRGISVCAVQQRPTEIAYTVNIQAPTSQGMHMLF